MAAGLGVLAGCQAVGPNIPPQNRPVLNAIPETTPSAESALYAQYYTQTQARLLREGLLRQTSAPTDAPVSRRALARNFETIALYDEYTMVNGRFVARQTPSRLRRWREPVRLEAHFGPANVPQNIQRDRQILGGYATQLSRAARHPVELVQSGGNFHVLFISRDEQAVIGPYLRGLIPDIDDSIIREIVNLPRFTFCAVYAFATSANEPEYRNAIAIIRSEHPDLMRQSCVHEEIAQGLGLPNDSPTARPSIFNDDEEFALMTAHDELLLRVLYDPRLEIGMTPDEARPIVEAIAAELIDASS
ncbi:DUF2927 domain-containing protein [Rhodobacteraceae bacterium XHP0102]|nr:DUF2927 domain-containing protein [Rhodobacteraceae bacterium XHP0102]